MKFDFSGKVIRGVDLGARFGIATANIDTDFSLLPMQEGVYFVMVQIMSVDQSLRPSKEDIAGIESIFFPAIMHYGARKTFGGDKSIEIHLLDFTGDLYGKTLEVQVLKFYRPIQKFPNADLLFTQIENDIIKAKKYFLRRICKQKWHQKTVEDTQIFVQKTLQKLANFAPFIAAQNILLFVPLEDEIPYTQDLFYGFKSKKYFWPKVDVVIKAMDFIASDLDELVPGAYTMEPKNGCQVFDVNTTEKTLIFVPALAVTTNGKRLGRGAGFYDRFLEQCVENKNISTVSVQPKFAVMDDLPVEKHDQVLDQILVV